jgi:hypothetical protein
MTGGNRWRRFSVAVFSLIPWMVLAPLVVAEESTASSDVQVVDTWAGTNAAIDPGAGNDFQLAAASWTVPKVSCPAGTNSDVSIWAGSGGGTSGNPLFQAGTESECSSGIAGYRAWWEEFPVNHQQDFADEVHAGDVMNSFIRWVPSRPGGGGTSTMELDDFSPTGTKKWVEYRTISSAPPSDQAECIIERPLTSGSHEPLADFGTTRFKDCKVGWEEDHKFRGYVYLIPNKAPKGLEVYKVEMAALLHLSNFTPIGGFTGTWKKGS